MTMPVYELSRFLIDNSVLPVLLGRQILQYWFCAKVCKNLRIDMVGFNRRLRRALATVAVTLLAPLAYSAEVVTGYWS
ncbi:MAG: hypothetical protein L7S45_08025, partial [Luminiphilus sp.]|nr:hypothetical protein [Luminiphilus sp.]